jgi:L-asparaginase
MPERTRPRIAVYSLGGTIAMVPGPDGSVTPALTGPELIAAVPGLEDLAVDLQVHDFRRLPGASLSFKDLLELARTIEAAVEEGMSGIVISQGTDTIEETSFFLDLLFAGDAPVVVTGAMRNPSMAGADGPANLLAAIQCAASDRARGLGCLVVFANEIHAARWVRKGHTGSVAAFASPGHGPLGHVYEGRTHLAVSVRRAPAVAPSSIHSDVRVGLHTSLFGEDAELLKQIGDHVDGLVVAAFGVGHVPAATVPVLTDLATRMPVILASRTSAGPVHEATYGFPGSETDLLGRGLISAGSLDPLKARLLLHVLLAAGNTRDGIVDQFAEYGRAY